MSRRILTAILTITVLAVVLFGVPLAIGLRRLYRNEAVVLLEREAARASIEVPASFERRATRSSSRRGATPRASASTTAGAASCRATDLPAPTPRSHAP